MIGYILAAGFGVRMKPLTDHIPKALVPVCGMPLLQRNLNFLRTQGIETIGVNTFYKSEQVATFREQSAIPFSLFQEKGRIRGTAGPLFDAKDFLSADAVFCVQNVDILSNAPVNELCAGLEASDAIGYLLCSPPLCDGTIYFDKKTNAYCGIPADTVYTDERGKADFIGVALYKREILSLLSEEDFSIITLWKRAQEKGYCLKIVILEDREWIDIGTTASLAKIHFALLHRHISLPLPESIQVDYDRKIAAPKGIYNFDELCWGASVWTDSDKVSPHASIRRSIILSGAHIPSESVISDMIVTPTEMISIEQ